MILDVKYFLKFLGWSSNEIDTDTVTEPSHRIWYNDNIVVNLATKVTQFKTISFWKKNYIYILVRRKNRWRNLDELQVTNNKSADRLGRMGNPDGPYTRDPLRYCEVKKKVHLTNNNSWANSCKILVRCRSIENCGIKRTFWLRE